MFATWAQNLPAEIEVCAVQLPGRENRIAEDAISDMEVMASTLGEIFSSLDAREFAVFGHSAGGLIAFEVARWLRRNQRSGPVKLFVAGSNAPHVLDNAPPVHRLPDAEFIETIRKLDGTPTEVLANSQLMELLVPMLRADMRLVETYVHRREKPLPCDLHVFGASSDEEVSLAGLAAWKLHTSGHFGITVLPGDHFFVRTSSDFMPRLRTELEDLLSR